MQAYVMDSYRKYIVSASAASQFLRSLTGFAFPLFAPKMYEGLGYGWGNSLLTFLYLAIGVPAPLLLEVRREVERDGQATVVIQESSMEGK
jgi:hypothetical protein